MGFAEELANLLPDELPNRAEIVRKTSRHLDLIVEANRHFNLTRITDPREAAIKHVVDSLIPWQLFADARHVVDAGSGAGYPGIPLAVALPAVRFTLAESVGKKARFIETVVKELELANVEVAGRRAEEALRSARADVMTARAVAPIERAVGLFAAALKQGTRALLFKGPDAEEEIGQAQQALRKWRLRARVVRRYELPGSAGSRTIVELASAAR